MIENKVIKAYRSLDARVRDVSKEYFHTRPLAQYKVDGMAIFMDLRDVLLASALSANEVLISGSTGEGKTHLSKMFMCGLFGNKYKILQMDASFSMDKLRDMAYNIIAEGGRLKDAVQGSDLLFAPGVIIDEYTRAPAEITNIIQGWLQNGALVFEGGREISPGVELPGIAGRYQWKIATINEGIRYVGARRVDKASRDRLAVEIPLDIFRLTDGDKRQLASKKNRNIDAHDGDVSLDDFAAAMNGVQGIAIGPEAEEFMLYLLRMNQCTKTPNHTKLEIDNFSPEYCKGCRLSSEKNNLCGSVYAPSNRSKIALQNLGRSFALARAVKSSQHDVSVELEDIMAAAPFVFYGKIDIHPGWIERTSKSSRWEATINVLKFAYERFGKFISANHECLKENTPETIQALQKYALEKDAWAYEI